MMDLLSQILGAFLGAFAAFILVIVTDMRRTRKKGDNFLNLLAANIKMAESKLNSVEKNYKIIQDTPKLTSSYFIPFSLTEIKKVESEIIDDLNSLQILSIDAICFTMYTSDKILEEIVSKVKRIQMLKATVGEQVPERIELIRQVKEDYNVAIETIKKVINMLEQYTEEDYDKLLSKQD